MLDSQARQRLPQLLDTGLGDLRVADVQMLKVMQSLEKLEACISDLGVAQLQPLEVGRPFGQVL
jgi:hypothetical protein